MPPTAPPRPLPPRLRSDEPGSFSHDTMTRRVRGILRRVFRENEDLPPVALDALRALDDELANAGATALSPLPESKAPDVHHWNSVILAEIIENKETWLSAPWIDAEFYLYRRIIGAVQWFETGFDPFRRQKELGLASATEPIALLAERTLAMRDSSNAPDIKPFVLAALWGNRMDLSLWPVGSGRSADVVASSTKMILSDDSDAVVQHLLAKPGGRVDIIVDNAGFELFTDLCLADALVTTGVADAVHMRLKGHPTFVSDALTSDVMHTINNVPQQLGARWRAHVESRRWILVEHLFWCQPTPLWEMPTDLVQDLRNSRCAFVKGDANYRRILGERLWPLDTPFGDIAAYFPAPVCALRTLKSPVGCGMPTECTNQAAAEDDRWLVDGKYGVVQFVDPLKHSIS